MDMYFVQKIFKHAKSNITLVKYSKVTTQLNFNYQTIYIIVQKYITLYAYLVRVISEKT